MLYLTVSDTAISFVLVREKAGVEYPIYYVNKVMLDAETRYTDQKKLALALLVSCKKLQLYFQTHTVVVSTNQLLKQILQRPDLFGRLVKWSFVLSDFDIQYKLMIAIKG